MADADSTLYSDTYRYNEVPTYTTSQGCPVRSTHRESKELVLMVYTGDGP